MAELLTYRFPTTICFGPGARSTLTEFAEVSGVRRPLLVTDAGLPTTDAYRLAADEMDRVWPRAWESFHDVHPNPLESDVESAANVFAESQRDGIVGVGGGSALDAAKALRLKVAFPETALTEIPLDRCPDRLTPYCAIPTTAGTGSEVGRSAVITVPALGRKVVIGASPMMPEPAILDPQVTVGLPPHLTAATGMDAMTHAIESFVCPIFHPMCDAIALEAIRMVRDFLPRAVADGGDIEARGQMLIAASMGAVSFQKDLGAAHSMAHPLSTEFGIHHGLANAIVLPAVVRFNGESDPTMYERVADALGVSTRRDAAEQVAAFLCKFNASIGLTQRLRDLDVPRERLAELAEKAEQDECHLTNPRMCNVEHFQRLYEDVW